MAIRRTGGNFDFVDKDVVTLPTWKKPTKDDKLLPKGNFCRVRGCMNRPFKQCVNCEKSFCEDHITPKAVSSREEEEALKRDFFGAQYFHYCKSIKK